jgi:2'-5' RNA ligase
MVRLDAEYHAAQLPFRAACVRKPEGGEHVTLLYLDRVDEENTENVAAILEEQLHGTAPKAAFTFSTWTVFQGNSDPKTGYLVALGQPEEVSDLSLFRQALRSALRPFAPREDHVAWNPHISTATLPMAEVPEAWQLPLLVPIRWEAQELILYAKTATGWKTLATIRR